MLERLPQKFLSKVLNNNNNINRLPFYGNLVLIVLVLLVYLITELKPTFNSMLNF